MQASEKLGLSTHTIHDLLNGKTWPSMAVVARIETRLHAQLWTGAHELAAGPDYHGGKSQLGD